MMNHKNSSLVANAQDALITLAKLRANVTNIPREIAVNALNKFLALANQHLVTDSHATQAHYILCVALDEAYYDLTDRTGESFNSLSIEYHQNSHGGERFFELCDQYLQIPEQYIGLLQLCWLILATGFCGKYALDAKGTSILLSKRKQIYKALGNNTDIINADNAKPNKLQNKKIRRYRYLKLIIPLLLFIPLLFVTYTYLLNNQRALLQAHITHTIVPDQED